MGFLTHKIFFFFSIKQVRIFLPKKKIGSVISDHNVICGNNFNEEIILIYVLMLAQCAMVSVVH